MFCPQIPAALITCWAKISNLAPLPKCWQRTPSTVSPSRINWVTIVRLNIRAPCSLASSTLAAHRRKGSSVPSGTFTAPIKAGLTFGSSNKASLGVKRCVSIPASLQA
ncbi:Uncharacterised protein [Vibrio cholerae]|nr:Uncharacterised protein [Vibrio cholerae]